MNDRPEVPVAKRVDCSKVAWVIMSYLGTGNCCNTDGWRFHLLLFLTLKLLYHLRFIKSHQSQGSCSQNHSTYNWKHFMTPTEQQVEKLLHSLLGSTRDQQTCTAWMESPFQTGLTPLLPPGILNKQRIKQSNGTFVPGFWLDSAVNISVFPWKEEVGVHVLTYTKSYVK